LSAWPDIESGDRDAFGNLARNIFSHRCVRSQGFCTETLLNLLNQAQGNEVGKQKNASSYRLAVPNNWPRLILGYGMGLDCLQKWKTAGAKFERAAVLFARHGFSHHGHRQKPITLKVQVRLIVYS
jgi:hypothetical protein